ncbi:MAG: tRNA lysidine(34) synthetase TilS [Haliea sp.]|uniref:tRNA lysidine(34) synthetase TilS n=1 Tax=Haliea sp. TaxID=1932666 RepID=UPI000C5A9E89|nr:tRNA lysidine(34) synthetase TilS [Haliea sp.]MBM68280.1 tRNA lysidine(34) synthetase TilS [Haliea sp.]
MAAPLTPPDSDPLGAALGAWHSARRWLVAFSGGLDSTVLLHALCSRRVHGSTPPIIAVHINHQLHADAGHWQARAQTLCATLGVPLELRTVRVRQSGSGLEAAAREARYAALESLVGEGDVMFFAHHQDDQVETVLLRWLRGAGLHGLQGMPAQRPLGRGQLARPLLEQPRSVLEAYAAEHALSWIEDPSNTDTSLDRNYLRHEILPAIARRWPAYRGSIARSARQLGAAESVLDGLLPAPRRLLSLLGDPGIDMQELLALPDATATMALRGWLVSQGLLLPPATALAEFMRQLRAGSAGPLLAWRGHRLCRFGAGVFLLPTGGERSPAGAQLFPGGTLALAGGGQLRLLPAGRQSGLRLPPGSALTLQWRRGGERCRLPGRAGNRRVKTLLQDAGIPPWWREQVPLLFLGDALVAVADLWLCDGPWFAPEGGEDAWRVCWTRNTAAGAIEL